MIHRDVKPDNILLHKEKDGQIKLKLIDFGFSQFNSKTSVRMSFRIGSIEYRAPEAFELKHQKAHKFQYQAPLYGYEMDIWSLGCILY